MNKYRKLFKKNMTPKQIAYLYFSLCDSLRGDEDNTKLLDEAFLEAYKAAEDAHPNCRIIR